MGAALEKITDEIKEEARVAILEQIKILREGSPAASEEARNNLEVLLKVRGSF